MKICSFESCERNHCANGYCDAHYRQTKKGKKLSPLNIILRGSVCSFENCNNIHCANGFCEAHNKQLQRGNQLKPLRGNRVCDYEGCTRKHSAKGYCKQHYNQLVAGEELKPITVKSYGHINVNGYRVVFKNNAHILEHRWIMEQYLNRKLLPHENVHHLNGDRLDNRITNLELWSTYQPRGQRIKDKITWAKEILALYGEEESNWDAQA